MPLDCQLGIVAMWGEWEGFVKWLMECCRVEVWEQNRVLAGFGIGGKIGKSYYRAIGKRCRKEHVLEHKRGIQESLLILTTNTLYHSKQICRIPRLRRIQDHFLTLKNTSYPHQQIRRK
ncbi:hypothetical protein Tco_0367419 [Tanacetum coccineum]